MRISDEARYGKAIIADRRRREVLRAGLVDRRRGQLIVREGGVVVAGARAKVLVPTVLTCAVFGAINRRRDLLALCHIVQHGRDRSPAGSLPTQYADNAVEEMANLLEQRGEALAPRLGQYFLVGSSDLIVAHYLVRTLLPRYGLSARNLVSDIGPALERQVWFDRGGLYVQKSTAASLEVGQLI